MTSIDIHPADLETVQRILHEHVPALDVRAFGSRVAWRARETSDLDLALMTDEPLTVARMADLRAAFTNADLPFRVDIVDWANTSESFRRIVETEYVALNRERRGPSRGWLHCALADACNAIDYGLAASASKQPNGPRFLRITDIVSGPIDWNSVPYVKVADDTCERYQLQDGDVVVARTGASTGSSAYVKNPPCAVFASYLVRLRVKPDFDPRFIAYFLRSEEFRRFIHGVLGDKSAQPNASASTMAAAPLRAPRKKAEQHAIAHILGALDDKIELNRRMSKTLEAMVRALFKSWFVDFDPVRAKMAGRDTGLPTEIAELFPDRMVDSKLGRTPEGWPVSTLGDYLDATRGLSYKGSALSENGVAMHNLNSIREGGGYKYGGLKYYDGPRKERHAAHPGDVIVANTEQGHDRRLVGYAAIVPGRHRNGLFSHHLYRVRAKEPFNSEYVCHLLNTAAMHDAVSGYATGTTVNMLPSDALWIPEILVPEPRIVAAFGTVAATISDRMEAAHEESENLACLRDSLLPRLVSGELRVGQMDPPVRCA